MAFSRSASSIAAISRASSSVATARWPVSDSCASSAAVSTTTTRRRPDAFACGKFFERRTFGGYGGGVVAGAPSTTIRLFSAAESVDAGSSSSQPAKAVLEEEVDPGVVEGTDLRIVKYPHPALRAENADVTPDELKDGSIARLAKEMFLVMYAAEGVGLAAPQVGVNKRLMVYNEQGDPKKWLDEQIMVNPKIVDYSDAKEDGTEGCLSFPGMSGDVSRSKWIKVESLNMRGKKIKRKFTGWEARIFQHEYDHLDGVVYIDRLTEDGRKDVQPRLDELIGEFGEGGAL